MKIFDVSMRYFLKNIFRNAMDRNHLFVPGTFILYGFGYLVSVVIIMMITANSSVHKGGYGEVWYNLRV